MRYQTVSDNFYILLIKKQKIIQNVLQFEMEKISPEL